MSAENKNQEVEAFELSSSEVQPSLVAEFIDFLQYNKKFWMIPLLGSLIALGGTAAAPFIYAIW